ncbi:MAG: tetratricopeptide repeat protein [Bryobacteraceae bacterium]
MARITRKELKSDKFALEVEHTVDFFGEHHNEILRYGGIALAVIAIGVAIWLYRSHEQTVRQQALSHALEIQAAPVGQAPPGAPVSFPTQEAKDKEAVKAFSELAVKYSGTDEGSIAEYYLGCMAADQGKLADAEKRFQSVADSGSKQYSSLAKLSLGQIYFSEGKTDQGEKLMRALMDHPTIFVSKEQATLALAKGLITTKPAEARKLLEPLRATRGPASQAAIQAFAELPPQ